MSSKTTELLGEPESFETEQMPKGQPLKVLFFLYQHHVGSMALSAFFYILQSAPMWIIPIISSNIINCVTHPEKYNRHYFWINLAVGLASLLQNVPTASASMRYLSKAVRNVEAGLRGTIVRKLQKLSMSFHGELPSGKVQAKVLRDVEAIEGLSKQMMRTVFPAFYNTVVTMIIVLNSNASIALFFVAAVPTGLIIVSFFRKQIQKCNRIFRKRVERMSGRVSEMIEMMPVTRSHGLEEVEVNKVDSSLRQLRWQGHRLDVLEAFFGSSTWVTFQGFQLLCLAFTAYWVLQGKIPVGNIVMYQSFFGMMINSVSQILTVYPNLMKGFESIDSVSEILLAEDVDEYCGRRVLKDVRGDVTFESVCFSYAGAEKPVLQDFDLEVRTGESIALVGTSGAGKSTVLNLIIGFYKPTTGRVLIDGVPMDDLDMQAYRHNLAVVLQNNILFGGSLRDNITYGLPDVSDEQLWEVIRMANLHDVVEELPDGLDTIIGEHGGKLSGGQRQRIAIARALIRDPRIIILDEATSALDTISEQHVQVALNRLMEGRTTFIVAHRLSTVRNADRIVVMDKGAIVEVGSYEELVERQGVFYRLERAQVAPEAETADEDQHEEPAGTAEPAEAPAADAPRAPEEAYAYA